jgi:hypothetical protein
MSTEYRDYRIATGSNIDIFAKLPEVNITDSFIDDERKDLFRSTDESVKAIKEQNPFLKMPMWLKKKIEAQGFENWLNEAKEKAVSISTQAIKEHQERCKKVIEISNMTDEEMANVFEKEWERQEAKLELIDELRIDLKHINLDQYAGKTREIMEKLTKLVNL